MDGNARYVFEEDNMLSDEDDETTEETETTEVTESSGSIYDTFMERFRQEQGGGQ